MGKKKLFVLCGPAGCGKSTWIQDHKNLTASVVSRDTIRLSMLTNEDAYFSKEKEVYKEFIKEIKDALEISETVYADATHLTLASRTKLLRSLGTSLKDVEVIAVALKVPINIAIARNNEREGLRKVPEGVIKSMYKDYTIPTIEEGFNKVIVAEFYSDNFTYQYFIEIA